MKKDKEEKKLVREETKRIKKASKKRVDKMRLATQIIAALMAILMVIGIGASFMYYILKMI